MDHGVHFIGLEETMKQEYTDAWFRSISGPKHFIWQQLSPSGKFGGLLLGVNADVMEVLQVGCGDHYIRMQVLDRKSKCKTNLIVVYGPAQPENKDHFLAEFSQLCYSLSDPSIIGGDFNILRKTSDKNKPCVLPRWSMIFNSIIENNGLKELPLHGRLYTWANKLDNPTFEKIDRILVSTDWDLTFPLATVTGMSRDLSDHVPLLLAFGTVPPHSDQFIYEKCRIEREGFLEVVKQSWNAPTYCQFDMDKW